MSELDAGLGNGADGGFPSTLDLSTADLKGFDPIPKGTYDCVIVKAEAVEASNPEGALPIGTAGINVQFKVDGGPYDNRMLFNRYWMPAADTDYDATKRDKLLGMLARFLMAIGYTKEEVTGGNFNMQLEDFIGRECKVGCRIDEEYNNNKVTVVKPKNAAGAATSTGAGIL